MKRTISTGSIEYSISLIILEFIIIFSDKLDGPSSDDEYDSHLSIRSMRKSIITTRSQAAARNYSKNRRKSSPPKKRLSLQLSSHRPNTRINRRIIEQDLKLLRQGNVISSSTNPQPLDLSLGRNHSSSYEETIEKITNIETIQSNTQIETIPIEGVLDLSVSR